MSVKSCFFFRKSIRFISLFGGIPRWTNPAMADSSPHKKMALSVLGAHAVMADLMVFREVAQYLTPQPMAKWTNTCKTLYEARCQRLRVFKVNGVPSEYSAHLMAFVNSLKGAHTINIAGRYMLVIVIGVRLQRAWSNFCQ